MSAEDNITLFLLVVIVIVAVIGVGSAVVDKINHQKEEIQQPKQNEVLEMNIHKPKIVTGTCEVCGRKGVELGFYGNCLLYTSPSPRDLSTSRMPSSA